MKVRKVVVVNDWGYVNGGAGFVAIESAIGLAKVGLDVVLLCAVGPIDDRLERVGVKVVCTNQCDIKSRKGRLGAMTQGLWNVKSARALRAILRSCPKEEAVVHFHAWMKALSPSLFRETRQWGGRVFVTNHDFFAVCPNGGMFNYKRMETCKHTAGAFSCALSNCDSRCYAHHIWRFVRQKVQDLNLWHNRLTAITISDSSERMLRGHYDKHRIDVRRVVNPVGIGNGACKADVSANNEFVFLGRVSNDKGARLFCEAVSRLGGHGLVIGDGECREELEAQFPAVSFVGWQEGEAKIRFMLRAKALVLPSLQNETFGLSVIEAMSLGIPCVVPGKMAPAENVEDGVSGFLFDHGSLESLVAALRRVLASDIGEIQKNINDGFDAEKWSIGSHVQRLCSVYDEALRGNWS